MCDKPSQDKCAKCHINGTCENSQQNIFDKNYYYGPCSNCKNKPLNYDGFCRAYSTLAEYEYLNDLSSCCEKYDPIYKIKCGNCKCYDPESEDYGCIDADLGILELDMIEAIEADTELLWCSSFRSISVL
jgi:hypothetical protein